MTGCNHGKSDDELTRKDLFDVIEIYKKENAELKKQIENIKYLDRNGVEGYLRLKFGYRYEFETIENRDIGEAVKHICNLALPITKKKVVTVGDINRIVQILSRNLPLEIGGKICNGKLFEQIASEILEG